MIACRLVVSAALAASCALLGACRPSAAPDEAPASAEAERPGRADAAVAAKTAPPRAAPAGDGPAARTGDKTRPSLRVPTIDGGRFDLAERRGRWVVVNFWATWCAPCLKEMPELSALDALRDHVEVVGLAYEDIEPAEMRAFLEKRPVVYPIAILDPYDPPADFDTPRALPMTYLIGPDGTVVKRTLGPVTAQDIERDIAAAGGPELAS